jgi:Tol biopolymer transport system component/type II secretory pathway pseudopilin PulG
LIELLVVILIIGILIAVSAPSFLGQTQKAHDSEAKQYLTVAYKAAKASSVDRDGKFVTGSFTATQLAAAIQVSEPALTVATGTCPASADANPKHIFVGAGTVGDSLEICNDPSHTVWTLTVTHNGPPIITSNEVTSGSSETTFSGPAGDPINNSTGWEYSTPATSATNPVQVTVFDTNASAPRPTVTVSFDNHRTGSLSSGYLDGSRFHIQISPTPSDALGLIIAYNPLYYSATTAPNDVAFFNNGTKMEVCPTGSPCLFTTLPYGNGAGSDGTQFWNDWITGYTGNLDTDFWNIGYKTYPAVSLANAPGDIAFISNRDAGFDSEIYTMDSNGANQRPLLNLNPNDSAFSPLYSADHSRLFFVYNRGAYQYLYTVKADGSGFAKINFPASHPSFSGILTVAPDGGKVAYASSGSTGQDIFVANSDGSGTPQSVMSDDNVSQFFFLANDQLLVLYNDTAEMAIVDLSGNLVHSLGTVDFDNFVGFTISPDGDKVVSITYDPATSSSSVQVASGPAWTWNTVGSMSNPNANSFSVSPSGDRMAFTAYTDGTGSATELYVMNLLTGTVAVRSNLETVSGPLSWLDEDTVAFSAGSPTQVYTAAMSGPISTNQLTASSGYNQQPTH